METYWKCIPIIGDCTQAAMQHSVRWHSVEGDTVRPRNGSAYNDYEVHEVVAVLQQIIEMASGSGTVPFSRRCDAISSAGKQDSFFGRAQSSR